MVAVLWLLSGCSGGTSAPQPQQAAPPLIDGPPAIGDRLVSATIGDATNLIPMIAGDASSHEVADQLYLSLLKYDKELNLTGQLAASWRVSADNRTITFRLRRGIRWSDGKPFTSADCLFTLHLIQDPHTQSPYKSDYARATDAEAPDPYTFVVHYRQPYAPALSSWAQLAILPAHIFRGVDIMHTDLARHPKATLGPYRLKSWQAQQSITLTRNPDYFDGTVWIAERVLRVIPDPATQFLELSAGHIDEMGLTPIQYRRLFPADPRLVANYVRYRYLGFGYTYLGFNLKRPLFADVRVRRAIAYAIDRQELVDGVLMGLGRVIATPYKPDTYWVDRRLKPRPFDPARARRLLAEAGWRDRDGDGIVERDGRPLRFTILTNNGNRQRAAAATIIQQRLRAVGIAVQVRLVEWSAFIEHFVNTRRFDALILGWSLSPEPDQYSLWHSSQTGPRQFNFLSYHNEAVDAALVAATRTFDRATRKAYYDRVQQELYRDVPVVFLYAPESTPAIHRRIRGIAPAPAGIGYNSEHWFVPAAAQKYRVAITP